MKALHMPSHARRIFPSEGKQSRKDREGLGRSAFRGRPAPPPLGHNKKSDRGILPPPLSATFPLVRRTTFFPSIRDLFAAMTLSQLRKREPPSLEP